MIKYKDEISIGCEEMSLETKGKRVSELKELDGTVFYNYEDAKKVFSSIGTKKYTISDCVLILLYAHPEKPIFGRISLMKQVFLLTKEILEGQGVQDAKYIPHHFGMHSFFVMDEVSNLEFSKYVKRSGKKNSRAEEFIITDKGLQHISKVFDSLPRDIQKKIKEKRQGWDQLGYNGILNLAYTKYPEYTEKSLIKKRVKPVNWGIKDVSS